ncbi:conserved hypothetical protein [Novosphingobium aromaticivorans DSM 12444]|jgi:hypothetical protein|uniref:Uncharacterized protein n=1 Tax=Novosphingobium aromaticivorans (strain ATCC 700278 / DSM 12444 / CCUG 56034 / CIP 105152 / NBRC 16084 / F199) TaxID=279238 RepID=Q2G3Z7_NOVAD|nr:hypothetical protein [Novosphingobium aromaticivorans]ABD27426.1 conserved hypothetical protein [Novosphingobium aromaticivorans DSM 12444]SCY69108.1 hypothetical protein SAMN05660666_02494 [Novosphingobium aromaticivorans]
MIRVRTADGLKAIAVARVRGEAGLQSVASGWLRMSDALKRVFSGSGDIAVSADPSSVSGYSAVAGSAVITTNAVTATPTNGSSPYTYAWTFVSSDGGSWIAKSPTSATTKFTCSGVAAGVDYTATFLCTATDSTGGTGTVEVQATASNLGNLYL